MSVSILNLPEQSDHHWLRNGAAGAAAAAAAVLAPLVVRERRRRRLAAVPPRAAAQRPHVVIVGAGFGGLALARELVDAPVRVTLIDRHNYHLFQPLLYQVATAALEPADIAYAIRGVLRRRPDFSFQVGEVTGVDWKNRRVQYGRRSTVPYDHLVLAAGAVTSTFGIPGVEEHGFGLKNLEDAVRLRSHLLDQFEQASVRPSLIAEGALNVVIVGGGPTGVELAGSVAELFHNVLAKDFPQLDVTRARIGLIEMAPALLGPFSPASQQHALEMLRERGVEVLLGKAVARVTPDEIELTDGQTIPARTLMWAAGVRASPLADVLGLEQTRGGRLVVNSDLTVPGHDNVWAIGDLAAATDEEGKVYPQVAPVAMQAARHVARQIHRKLYDQPTTPFRYMDKGSMATIGRRAAVAELPLGLHFKGTLAWLMWLFLHLMTLVGFRNRFSVLLDWTWAYFTHDRAARIVVQSPPPRERAAAAPAPAPAPPPA